MDSSVPSRDRLRDRLLRLPSVRWLNPAQLALTGIQVAKARTVGEFAARRENEAAQPAEIYDLSQDRDDLWIDYTADVGDGFDATYAIARSIAATETPDGERGGPPHGELLVLGGDEVYPFASEQNYRDRLETVYRAALPERGTESPAVLAVPGNHDWYDGLTSFLRVFCQGWLADVTERSAPDGNTRFVNADQRFGRYVGGWRTLQSRSYFAARLPHGWWLWGADIQFDTYIDAPQLAYFMAAAQHLDADDAIILCTAKPSWVEPDASPTLQRFVDRTLGDRAEAIRLICAGDLHHYSRYVPADSTGPASLVTCGGGGAYVSPTHHLPDIAHIATVGTDRAEFTKAATYPDAADSRRCARGFWRLPWRNPRLMPVLGATYALLIWLLAATQPGDGLLARLLSYSVAETRLSPASLPALLGWALVLVSTIGLVRPPRRWSGVAAGLTHGVIHLGVAIAVTYLAAAIGDPGNAFVASVLVTNGMVIVCGVAGAYVVACYLYVSQHWLAHHGNELFAGLRIEDFKAHLRLHVSADGVTMYPIGIRRVPRDWRASETGPLLEPMDGTVPELIEPPVTIAAAPPRSAQPRRGR